MNSMNVPPLSEQQWQPIGSAATAARSIFLTMSFTARGRYASAPFPALLASPTEPHIPEHMCDTFLLSRVDRALWRGCALGLPWLQK